MTNKTTLFVGIILGFIIAILSVLILLTIYYWPVIDRLANLCEHYPNAFIDCKE